jgi:hypothetical protein
MRTIRECQQCHQLFEAYDDSWMCDQSRLDRRRRRPRPRVGVRRGGALGRRVPTCSCDQSRTSARRKWLIFLTKDNMAKRTARTITAPSRKGSKALIKATKKQAKKREAVKKVSVKRVSADGARTKALAGRDARRQERFRELVAWYMLQGVDETTARRRAQDEIDDDPRKDSLSRSASSIFHSSRWQSASNSTSSWCRSTTPPVCWSMAAQG